MKHFSYGFAILTLLLFGCKKSHDDNENDITNTDQEFMIQASYANWAEMDLAGMAGVMGSADSIRIFGDRIILAHNRAEQSLDTIANAYNVNIPLESDAAHKAKGDYLTPLSGYTFDTAYINAEVIDHQAMIALYQSEASNGNNQSIKNYVNTYLPAIQMHLQEALTIQAQLE